MAASLGVVSAVQGSEELVSELENCSSVVVLLLLEAGS
jgi:hypothetical protein